MARTDNLNNFLTDVADSIREKKGTTELIPASEFDTEIDSISSGVDINEYFSETINGGSYNLGGWSHVILKFRTPLVAVSDNGNYMFNKYPLSELPQVDTSNVTNMSYMFYDCNTITTIPFIDTSKVTTTNGMFSGCSKLTTIPQLDTSNVLYMTQMFYNCNNLITIPQLDARSILRIDSVFQSARNIQNFGGFPNLGQAYSTSQSANYSNYTLNLSYSTKLTHDSLMNVINGLYDIKAKGCNPQSLSLGSENIAKLTSEEIAIATNKGWTVS